MEVFICSQVRGLTDSFLCQFQQRSPLPAQATTLPLVCEEESGSTPMDEQQTSPPGPGSGPGSVTGSAAAAASGSQPGEQSESPPPPLAALTAVKKSGARRNPWGSMSYADLITQARL